MEARDAAEHPTHTHESIATTKREPAPNSSGVEVEKSVLSHFTDKETMLQVPR